MSSRVAATIPSSRPPSHIPARPNGSKTPKKNRKQEEHTQSGRQKERGSEKEKEIKID